MGCTLQYDNYHITSEPGRLLPDGQVKYHNYHYKHGAKKFEEWLRVAVKYTKEELSLNFFPRLAEKYAIEQGMVPDEPLYNLQKWLKGRQVCYCHHLLKGDANDGHLRPIVTALELVQILRPNQSEEIIAECMPVNFWALLQDLGSETAKEVFAPFQSSGDNESPHYHPSMPKYEEKQRRMTYQSWRHSSTSSDNISFGGDLIFPSTSFSSSTSSLSSTQSITWSRKLTPTAPSFQPQRPLSYATAVNVPASSSMQSAKQIVAPLLYPFSGKLVLSIRGRKNCSPKL